MAVDEHTVLFVLIGMGVVAGLCVFSAFRNGTMGGSFGKAWFEAFSGYLGICALVGIVLLLASLYPWIMIGVFWVFVLLMVCSSLWDKRKTRK